MAQIEHKLDLVVRLTDTTTGDPPDMGAARFLVNGSAILLIWKEAGIYILLNRGRTNMLLDVQIQGFLPVSAWIDYNVLDPAYPQVEIALIPERKPYGYTDLITLEGCMPGIEHLDAAPLHESCALVLRYQEERQTLHFFSSKRLEECSYALLHEEKAEFEEIRIDRRIDALAVRLKRPLSAPCGPQEKVTRIIRGTTDAGGQYLLRVRQSEEQAQYLVRYTVNGETRFRKVDLRHPEDGRLE